jgi:DNA-damage-inducible protein D
MNKNTITKLTISFDALQQTVPDSDVEFWFARDLMVQLGYSKWQNFIEVIEKARIACATAGGVIENHFTAVSKMVSIGSGAERPIDDIVLTRYACYLIAQNGDPRKEPIAFAQTYFALQTRKQELIEERLRLHDRLQARQKLTESETELSKNIYERGVDNQGFGRIRSKGDAALFGGHTTQDMKNKLKVSGNRPLADFLPTVTIAAKNLAAEITNHNVKENDLQGEPAITGEHIENNSSVRSMLGERGIKPETLPPEEDLKKLERRVKSSEKRMIRGSELPKKIKSGDGA